MKSEVYKVGESRYDMTGRKISTPVAKTTEQISAGTCKRLLRYATDRVIGAGLDFVLTWDVVISTMNHDWPPSDRIYCVNWTNKQGTRISVEGIFTLKGYPHLDHGIRIAEDQ
jgi:hypothetical protein